MCAYAKSAVEAGAGIAVVGASKVYVDATSTLGYDGGIGVLLSILSKYVGGFRESGSVEM